MSIFKIGDRVSVNGYNGMSINKAGEITDISFKETGVLFYGETYTTVFLKSYLDIYIYKKDDEILTLWHHVKETSGFVPDFIKG